MDPTAPGTDAAAPGRAPGRARATEHDVLAPGLHRALVDLAGASESRTRFLRDGFRRLAESAGAVFASLEMRRGPEVLEDETHRGPDDPSLWRPVVRAMMDEAMAAEEVRAHAYQDRQGGGRIAVVGVPVVLEGARHHGVIGLVVPVSPEHTLAAVAGALQAAGSLLASLLDGVVGPRIEHGLVDGAGWPPRAVAGAVSWLPEAQDRDHLAIRITNELAARLGCDQVSLGLVRGRRVRVVNVSGFEEVRHRSPGVRLIRAAMEECLDRGRPIVVQREASWVEDSPSTLHRLHLRWHQSADGAPVATIPLEEGGRPAAIIALRGRAGQAFDHDILDRVAQECAATAGLLRLVDRAQRGVLRHLVDGVRESLVASFQPAALGRRLGWLAAISLALWLAVGTLPYRVAAEARLEPAMLQHVAAPDDAVLASVAVVAGDTVTAGQELCRLDVSDLELERARLRASIEMQALEAERRLAAGQPSEWRLAVAEQRVLEARLAALDHRIENGIVRARVDGTVIEGDLREQVGRPVGRGDALFTISPTKDFLVEIAVPESDVDHLVEGQVGRFASRARPDVTQPIRVRRVMPAAVPREGRTVFLVEAEVEAPPGWLRTGMEGIARVDAGERPAWWVLGHDVVDWVRARLWL